HYTAECVRTSRKAKSVKPLCNLLLLNETKRLFKEGFTSTQIRLNVSDLLKIDVFACALRRAQGEGPEFNALFLALNLTMRC
ncbi:MAG TPA: hypothetical protein PK129_09330, partial [Cellvibrionaceae bacterium]|nr:hypothetical protein [Cellvibrionaceae bacterium]